jgi:integrase
MDEALKQYRDGVYIEPSKETFGQYLDFWLENYAKPTIEATTYRCYEYLARVHIKPGFGKIIFKDLQPGQVMEFYNQLRKKEVADRKKKPDGKPRKTLSKNTIRRTHAVLHACLESAVGDNKIVRNPIAAKGDKKKRLPKVEKKEARYLSPETMYAFLERIKAERWYSAICTDVHSGLRIGELCNLRWSNINLEKGVMHVKEAVSPVKIDGIWQYEFRAPKSAKGVRTVPIPPSAVKELKRWKAIQAAEELKYKLDGYNNEGNFVFTTEKDGKMVDPGFLSKHFLKLTRKHKVSLNFDGIRHTTATAWLISGENLKTVQELLGDSSISVVADIYSHVIEQTKKQAASSKQIRRIIY